MKRQNKANIKGATKPQVGQTDDPDSDEVTPLSPSPKLTKTTAPTETIVEKTTTKKTTSVVPATTTQVATPVPAPVAQPQAPKPASTAALPQIQQPVVVQPLQTTAPAPTAQQPVVSNPPVTSEQPVTQGAVPPPQPATSTPSWWKKNRKKVLVITSIIGAVATLIGLVWRLYPMFANHAVLTPPHSQANTIAHSTPTIGAAMASELDELRKQVAELKSRPPTVVTQLVQVLTVPSSVVVVSDNISASNNIPVGTIKCKGFSGYAVDVSGNNNIVVGDNSTVTISSNGVIPFIIQQGQQPRHQQVRLPWPLNSKPTRIIQAEVCLLSSGVSSFSLPTETIHAGEDIGVLIPDGWAINSYSSANMGQIEVAVDGKINPSIPGRVVTPPGNRIQHHEMRFRLCGGLSEASLELLFYKL